MRVRLIEDDPMIGKAVRQGLRSAGFVVDWVVDGGSAETSLSRHDYALAVLDLGLPSQDGMQVLHKLRARGATLPVLIASARDAMTDRIAGLDAGADDYLAKPFDLDELVARACAMRRHAGSASPVLSYGALTLDRGASALPAPQAGHRGIRNVRGVGYRVAEPSPVAFRQERSAWRRRSDP